MMDARDRFQLKVGEMSGSFGVAQDWFAVTGQQAGQPSPGFGGDSPRYPRWPLASALELGPFATAPACARLHVKNVLAEWRTDRDLVPDAELITAELASNALRATLGLDVPQPIGLRLLASRQHLVIEAWDCAPGYPVRRPVLDDGAEDGRGLQIVEALASRWGCRRPGTHLKAVWAELLIPQPRKRG
jgi:anti-sigma regulatory factor (Ser/Thr protein kinase)